MKFKTCTTCNKRKSIEKGFYTWNNKTRSDCKSCHKVTMRPRSRRHYRNNKKYYLDRNKRHRMEMRAFVREQKTGKCCMDCKERHPWWRLDFDHRDGKSKSFALAQVENNAWTKKAAMLEMQKCDLVCANCHRDRTHNRRIGIVAQLAERSA